MNKDNAIMVGSQTKNRERNVYRLPQVLWLFLSTADKNCNTKEHPKCTEMINYNTTNPILPIAILSVRVAYIATIRTETKLN
jgi:hypothetical protein